MAYLNMKQLTDKLGGIARSSVYRLIEEGRLPKPLRLGGRLLWPESEIDEAMRALQKETSQ